MYKMHGNITKEALAVATKFIRSYINPYFSIELLFLKLKIAKLFSKKTYYKLLKVKRELYTLGAIIIKLSKLKKTSRGRRRLTNRRIKKLIRRIDELTKKNTHLYRYCKQNLITKLWDSYCTIATKIYFLAISLSHPSVIDTEAAPEIIFTKKTCLSSKTGKAHKPKKVSFDEGSISTSKLDSNNYRKLLRQIAGCRTLDDLLNLIAANKLADSKPGATSNKTTLTELEYENMIERYQTFDARARRLRNEPNFPLVLSDCSSQRTRTKTIIFSRAAIAKFMFNSIPKELTPHVLPSTLSTLIMLRRLARRKEMEKKSRKTSSSKTKVCAY